MTGYVYAVECMGRIKIGHSNMPEWRFNKIASDAPGPCVLLGFWPGSRVDEAAIHERFRDVRIYREWFASTEALRAFIGSAAPPPVVPQQQPDPTFALTFSPTTAHEAREITGEDVKRMRVRLGWTQGRLATYLGVCQPTVFRIENGQKLSGPAHRLLQHLIDSLTHDGPLPTPQPEGAAA